MTKQDLLFGLSSKKISLYINLTENNRHFLSLQINNFTQKLMCNGKIVLTSV